MLPALHPGDWLVVRWGGRVRVGDMVVVRRPDRIALLMVKRAVRREGDGWWVAGDNPSDSIDSRLFGAVPDPLVVGRVVFRYWPWRHTHDDG
jgi:nickel-type superoxide dismutase maturation protease